MNAKKNTHTKKKKKNKERSVLRFSPPVSGLSFVDRLGGRDSKTSVVSIVPERPGIHFVQ